MRDDSGIKTRKRTVLFSLLLAGVCMLVTLISFGVASATPTPMSSKKDNALGNPNYPFPTDAHPQGTQASLLRRQATIIATAATGIARNPQLVNRTPPLSTPDKGPLGEEGIFPQPLPIDYGPIYRNDATIENCYRTFSAPGKPNRAFVVVAGTPLTDPQAGFVGVTIYDKTGRISLNTSLTPTKHGSVHITDVKGSRVSLTAEDGTVFVFDSTTYMFV